MKNIKNILTNYLFSFLFEKYLSVKNGDLLKCQDEIFIFDDENGNPNNLKNFYKQNGFWNYVKAKEGSIYNMDKNRFITNDETNSQGYNGLEYYKNCIDEPTEEERIIYYSKYNSKTN